MSDPRDPGARPDDTQDRTRDTASDRTQEGTVADASSTRRSPAHPERIGGYRILRQIGEGGMGTVYEAEQENPRRTVALKVLRAGAATPQTLRRFELESQVLALLQHPGIAQIYEAGTADTGFGPQPYFAMERVQGRPLTVYAERKPLSLDAKLALFAGICDAVHHAHQKGVIHRDLKPANILVDDTGAPKVLDFGVARATDSDIQATMQTDVGAVVGTVPYMSPEQIQGKPEAVDTRTDVFSLGVVLYQLLTGRLPHDFTNKTLLEAARLISEEDPPSLAAQNRLFRGDVDTIAAKAMEKDKTRRYQSAAELAADVRRYLNDEPITARPPSTAYQLRKFARRNRALVAGVIAVFVVLAGGIVVSLDQAGKARREARTTASINAFLHDMLRAASPMALSEEDTLKGRDVRLVDVLHAAGDRVEQGSLAGQPLVEAAVDRTLGATLRDLGDYDAAEPFLVRSLDIRRQRLGGNDPKVAESMDSMGELLHTQGKFSEAEPLFRKALDIRRKRLGPDDPEVARTLHNLAELLEDDGRPDEALPLFREALDIRRRKLGKRSLDTADTMNSLALALQEKGRFAAAESLYAEVLDIRREGLGEEHPEIARTLHDLAMVYKAEGKLSEAESAMRRAVALWRKFLGDDHPFLGATLMNLGVVLKDQGKLAAAESLYTESLAIQRKTLGPDHPNIGGSLYNRAKLLQAEGKLEAAEADARESLAILGKVLPTDDPTLAAVESGLGSILTDRGRPAEGEPLLRHALKVYEDLIPGRWEVEQIRSLLGDAVLGCRRFAEAETLLVPSYEVLKDDPAVSADRKAQALERVARLYTAWNAADPGAGKGNEAARWQARVRDNAP